MLTPLEIARADLAAYVDTTYVAWDAYVAARRSYRANPSDELAAARDSASAALDSALAARDAAEDALRRITDEMKAAA